MPLEWLSNYERFHQDSQPIQTTESAFTKQEYGNVKTIFLHPQEASISHSCMITPHTYEPEEKIPIVSFTHEGWPIYTNKINGHFIWDVPKARMCDPGYGVVETQGEGRV